MNLRMLKSALAGLVLTVSGFANAGLITFDLEWSGQKFGNNAAASGFLVIDDAVFINGGSNSGTNWVNDFGITISGASNGNGSFSLLDFSSFLFNSNGSPLDLSTELVGQLVTNWGTCQGGACGDFNIFRNTSGAPTGTFHNRLTPSGSSDNMQLISFAPVDVPEPSTLAIFALGIMGLASRRFKKQS